MTTLEKLLGDLDASGLIRLVQHDADPEYQFRHVLTQEAAYGSLLKQDRRRLHLLVGLALEREYANRLDEVAPILARHFDEAENDARALEYYMRAADAATARFANAEATMHYRRALVLAQRGQISSEQMIDLYLKHGRVLEISGNYAEAMTVYVEMETQAQERSDQRMLLAALMARATIHAAPTVFNNTEAADDLAKRALVIAEELNDRAAEAKTWWLRMMTHRFNQYAAAIEYGERVAAISRELNLREQLAYVLNDIFPSYVMSGQVRRGCVALEEAEQLWRELDNPNLLADTLTSAGEIAFFMGKFDEGIAKLRESLQISERTGNAWGLSYARWIQGEVMFERADYAGAIAAFHDSIRLGAQAGFAISQIASHGYLALVYAELGAYDLSADEALKAIDMALHFRPGWQGLGHAVLALCQFQSGQPDVANATLAIALQNNTILDLSNMITEIARAEIDLAGGHYETVAQNACDAIKDIRNFELIVYEPHLLFYEGVAWLKLGQLEQAAVRLADAKSLMDKMGTRRHLWRVQLARAACERQLGNLGNEDKAAELQEDAQAEVLSVIVDLPTNFRASFQGRVDAVRRDLAHAG